MMNVAKINKLTVIGAGNMAEALLQGIVKNQVIKAENIWVTNRSNEKKLQEIHEKYHVNISYEQEKLLSDAEVVMLAMKPKDVAKAMEQIQPYLTDTTMIISVLAGVSMDNIEALAEKSIPVVRVMPNTSAAIGLSATAVAINEMVTEQQQKLVKTVFDTVGLTVFVKEEQLDAVTGVSGSGPAYIYYLAEAMEKGALEVGLEPAIAKALVQQTLLGAATMLEKSTKTPEQLRKEVTSPGGTTEAGLNVLGERHVNEAIIQCIKAANDQSKQLGKNLTEQLITTK